MSNNSSSGSRADLSEHQAGELKPPPQSRSEERIAAITAVLSSDPGVGFTVIEVNGVVRFMNRRAAELLLPSLAGRVPDEIEGRHIADLFGEQWATDRLAILSGIANSGRPAVLRHIRHGVRLQTTIRLVGSDTTGRASFTLITVTGEHHVPDESEFDVFESDLVHLGPLDPLTKRELEILALVGHGLTAREIAGVLFRSPRTVEQHIESIRRKLDATSRVELAEAARRAGLRLSHAERERLATD